MQCVTKTAREEEKEEVCDLKQWVKSRSEWVRARAGMWQRSGRPDESTSGWDCERMSNEWVRIL